MDGVLELGAFSPLRKWASLYLFHMKIPFSFLLVLFGVFQPAVAWETYGELTASLFSSSQGKSDAFALDTADQYGVNWFALRIPLANGLAYSHVPAFFSISVGALETNTFELFFKAPLRRDLEAWHDDDLSSNLSLSPSELNINVPEEGWGRWFFGVHQFWQGAVQAGRFQPSEDLNPSPHSVVLGTAPPYHDAVWWQQKLGSFHFDFLVSSLNPMLMGTPAKVGEEAPVGSEAWQQGHLTVPNQRNRTYTEATKNLLLHKLQWKSSWGSIALIEQGLIGGKTLTWRELNPFMFWHNNYNDGFMKASSALEIVLTPTPQSQFYWQIDFEDIQSPVGETEGESNPTTLGALVGWRMNWTPDCWSRVDVVLTDPAFNNHRLPLQRMVSRQIYRSNHRAQDDPDFADTWVVDYPLGYHRGPDAKDLWIEVHYNHPSRSWGTSVQFAWLRQGAQEVWSDFDDARIQSGVLSGVVERENRFWVETWYGGKKGRKALLNMGVGIQHIQNENHVAGENRLSPLWQIGMTYTLSSRS